MPYNKQSRQTVSSYMWTRIHWIILHTQKQSKCWNLHKHNMCAVWPHS